MLVEEYKNFRNQYIKQNYYNPNTKPWFCHTTHIDNDYYNPNTKPWFCHTTHIDNVESIIENGLKSAKEVKSTSIGYGLGFSGSENFARLFHSPNTPFLFNRFLNVGSDNLVMIMISSEILDDKSVSVIGMSTHSLANYRSDYFHCNILQKLNNEITNNILNDILKSNINGKYNIYRESDLFFKTLTNFFNMPAQGYGWNRGEVLFSTRAAYPGKGEGQWGNIRAAEILIYPKVPPNYIFAIAATKEARKKIRIKSESIKQVNLTKYGPCND